MPRPSKKKNQPGHPDFSDPQDILMNAPVGIFTTTPDGRYLSVNNTLARMHGYDSPRQLMDSITDIATQIYVDPADREELKFLLEKYGKVTNLECLLRHTNGSQFWVSENIRVIKDKNGNVIAYQGFNQDITERKKTEQEAQYNRDLLELITDNMFDLVALTDLKGNLEFAGKSHSVLGYDHDYLIGRNVLEFVHPEDQPRIAREFKDFAQSKDDGRRAEYRYRCRDGSYLWFETFCKTIQQTDFHPEKLLFSTRDITSRKQKEEDLIKSRQSLNKQIRLLNGFLENAPDILSIKKPDLTVIRYNKAGYEFLGKSPEDAHGNRCYELLGRQSHCDNCVSIDAIRTKKPVFREKHVPELDTYFSCRANPVISEKGTVEYIVEIIRDITERKRTEEMQKIFFQMLQNSEHIAVFKDSSLKYVLINEAYTRLTGHTLSQVTGKTDKEMFQGISTPEQIQEYMENDRKALDLSPGKVITSEETSLDEQGQTRTFITKKFPVLDDKGLLLGVGTITSEITDRKRAEVTLSKSQKVMSQAEELADLGSWQWDIKNDTWIFSDNWKRIHGVADIQLKTPQLLPIAHPEDKSAIEEAFARATENGEPYDIEHRIIRQDTGEVRHVHSRGLVEMDDNGKPEAMVGAVQDITKLKQAQNLLVESEARFRSLFEDSPIAYQSLNKDGHYIDVNDRLCELLGYERSEILGRDFGELWSKRTRYIYPETFEEFKYSGCVKGELELIHKSGSTLFVLLEGRAQRDSEGKFIRTHCILHDITERKHAEEEIKNINQQLVKVNAEKDKLFSIIAHDLKSPMAGIFNTSQIIAQEAESLSRDDLRTISTEINKSTGNALTLLNDLMQWARMSQGGMDFNREECGLHELTRSSIYSARDMAEKKNVSIRCDMPQGLTVLADQPMINTVIRNLIFNAVKFTLQGGNISLTAREAESGVEICVQDDGIGMDKAIKSKIFSLDKSKRQYGTYGEKGTGLGLILCKEFVEKHGGRIWVESEPGKGSKVCFTLPAAS